MRCRFAPAAEARFLAQIQYPIDQGSDVNALRVMERIETFCDTTLCNTPQLGQPIEGADVLERPVTGTPYVNWYVYDGETVTIVGFWHVRQRRKT